MKTLQCNNCKGTGRVSVFQTEGAVIGIIATLFVGTKDKCPSCNGTGNIKTYDDDEYYEY